MLPQKSTTMKKLFFLPVAATLICSISFAKIWRVNSSPNVQADFVYAQAAHDGASAGDTLYFEHSPVSYGNLVMTKKLTLIGVGAFTEVHPGQQYTFNTALLVGLKIDSAAAGSRILSMCFNSCDVSASHIDLIRCYGYRQANNQFITSIYFNGAGDCLVTGCYLNNNIYFTDVLDSSQTGNRRGCSNILFSNNIIQSEIITQPNNASGYTEFYKPGKVCATCPLTYFPRHTNISFINNTLTSVTDFKVNGYIINNIFWANGSLRTGSDGIIQNNVFGGPANSQYRQIITNNSPMDVIIPAGNSNQYSVPLSTVLTNSGLKDTTYMLKPGSPAIGAGENGTDCGATGGSTPYRYGLQPAIPAIYKFKASAVVSGNTIQATVSTRSNN